MIQLGRFEYPYPVVVLAPMAGISDLPFRRICEQFGSHYTIAEMVSASPVLLATRESQNRLQFDNNPSMPKIVQLVGSDPQVMAETAQLMVDKGADVIDINMGCPAKKVGKVNAGSALLSDLSQLQKILETVCQRVTVPVTLKTRIGFNDDMINISKVAKIAVNSGVKLLTVHGRTRSQKFQGKARYEEIIALKKNSAIPIIVNGDIENVSQVKSLIDESGLDGVMLGRAIQGNPWLLNKIRCYLDKNFPAIDENPYSLVRRHLTELYNLYGQQGILIARKHLHWYVKTLNLGNELKLRINQATTFRKQIEITNYFPHN